MSDSEMKETKQKRRMLKKKTLRYEFSCCLNGEIVRVKARLHRRVLSRQLDAIFVALKLQLQHRTSKPGAISIVICRRDIAGVSNMFETCCNFSARKIASSCRDKNRLCKRASRLRGIDI